MMVLMNGDSGLVLQEVWLERLKMAQQDMSLHD